MKCFARRMTLVFSHVFLSLFIGWYVGDLYGSDTSSNMPDIVNSSLRWFVTSIGHGELYNPDDMYVLSGLLYWLIASLVVWLALLGAWLFMSKRAMARRNAR